MITLAFGICLFLMVKTRKDDKEGHVDLSLFVLTVILDFIVFLTLIAELT